jgi:lipid II:glycine glycyltransferase (peptidoglycan interpeptide bridge formation enzyme)
MKNIETVSFELWDEVAAKSEQATFFHTATWAKIMVATYPQFRIVTKGFELEDGEMAIIPILSSVERNNIFHWYESTYLGGYGGIIATRALKQKEIQEIYNRVTERRVAHYHFLGNPFYEMDLPAEFLGSKQYTHVMKLGVYEELYARIDRDKRAQIRKGKEKGTKAILATTEEDYQTYYSIYEDTLKRWGDKTLVCYEYDLFRNIFLNRNEGVKLWLAKVGEEIVSGKLTFYHNKIVSGWHAATLQSYFHYYPDQILMAEVIRDACENGFEWMDFGPSGGLVGVENYKKDFGAEKLEFLSYDWDANHLYHAYRNLFVWLHR